jgi:NADPH:quinone reductase-like Zn-dependent oxidoreductase
MRMSDSMTVVSLDRFGGPEVLTLTQRPRPAPSPTEILVRVRAAGVNPIDWKTRAGTGLPVELPFVPGWDVAGVVEEVGHGVTRFRPGDRVFGMPWFPRPAGAYGQYVTAPSRHFAATPDGLDDVAAAALPLAALTAWQALVDTADVQDGQTVLVHAGAGGVGHLAIQIAAARGARVIATARAARHGLLRELCAAETVDYSAVPFEEAVRDVDVAFDLVGGDTAVRSIPVLRPGGLLVAAVGGRFDDAAALARRTGRRATAFLVEPDGAGLTAIAGLVGAGRLRPVVAEALPLAEAGRAHEISQTGRTVGKLVLTVD